MRTFCFLLCIAYASCFYIDNAEKSKDKIVGGDFIDIEDAPYQASLFWYNAVNLCGASIIHESWILTAAHCVENKTDLSVRTGSHYRLRFGTFHKIEDIIMHSEYDTKSNDNDIALIKLTTPIEINKKQKPIAIAKPTDIPEVGQRMLVSGFGKVGEKLSSSAFLKAAYVPVMNQALCELAYIRDPITDNMFCAGNGGTDSCQGDSGGPGIIDEKQYGIVSSGMVCASTVYPGIYTRLYKYYDWIVEKTGIEF